MADLMTASSTWATGTTDTASTLANGVDQKRAEHINGPSSAIIAIETVLGSASSLKGSHADLATRLAVQLPASGQIIPPGTIWMYGGSSAPSGWLICDGSNVSRSTYADLFAVIGTDFGNTGGAGTTFNVPDFRSRVPVGVGTGTGGGSTDTTGTFPTGGATLKTWLRGLWYGEDTHQTSLAEMPAHAHTMNNATQVWRNTGGASNPSGVGTSGVATLSTNSVGSSQPHNNIQAGLGVNFIIKT